MDMAECPQEYVNYIKNNGLEMKALFLTHGHSYNFTYDSEKLSDIIDSVNPDVTICMGAFVLNGYRFNHES